MEMRRQSTGGGSALAAATTSILKKESFIDVRDDLDRALAAAADESPEQWFRRILRDHAMSPLDLCDRFCFGDARKYRHVPLKHVCAALFELERPGGDPMSEAMEDFLYGFSFDGGGETGEIVVDIKEALRTLDIWKTTAPVSPSRKADALGSPTAAVSPAKAAILEVKAEKLKSVIDSLQRENERLSKALARGSVGAHDDDARGSETRPPSPLRIAVKKAAQADATPSSRRHSLSSPQPPRSPIKQLPPPPVATSRHERELITLANRLEYVGVKKLEELVHKGDATGSGFVSLKQLRWLLANECRVGDELSEPKLMELCLGMNFNAQGQLDHKEFVRVLLDILVYERPPRRASPMSTDQEGLYRLSETDAALLGKVREYLRGFHGSREKTRELLESLCDKYDLEGNQCLSLAEMARVLQSDVASQHPVKLKFPLTQSETKRLLSCLSEVSARNAASSKDEFVFYPAILDALVRADAVRQHAQRSGSAATQALLARVLQPEFWLSLRSALCPHDQNASLERKIHAQLCKILQKLDPKQLFRMAQRHFVRVFDQHWSARDLEVLAQALSQPAGGRAAPADGSRWVRYDVLMKMLFGAPELKDGGVLAGITKKLQAHGRRWRDELVERTQAQGSSRHQQQQQHNHRAKLSYRETYELLCGDHEDDETDAPLNVTEFLYLVGHAKDDKHHNDHRVDLQKLWTLLSTEQRACSANAEASSREFTVLRRCLRVLSDDHDLEKTLARLARHERGVVRIDDLTSELCAQLRVLKLSPQEKELVDEHQIHEFLHSLWTRDAESDTIATSPGPQLLYVHALMDAIFDWDGFAAALRLPERLVDAKRTLELFDWDRDGSIDADDWTKAWRQLTVATGSAKPRLGAAQQRDWELKVLVRRFPAAPSERRSRRSSAGLGAIDYSRLLVFLLDRQQRVAREQLLAVVVLLLQQACNRVTRGKTHMSTFHLEQVFELVDRDGKGYFHIGDLRAFVLSELQNAQRGNGMEVQTLLSYASEGPALESVMAFLVGAKRHHDMAKPHGKKQVVSLMRFQELVNHGFFQHAPSGRQSRGHSDSDADEATSSTSDALGSPRGRSRSSSQLIEGQITLLRDLEVCVFEIAKQFVDAHGQIAPSAVYAHLNGVDAKQERQQHQQHRRPRSQSPVRSSFPHSPVASSSSSHYHHHQYSRRSSCTTPRSIADSFATSSVAVDPLTASRLKQTLRRHHGLETSTHLVGQFFLRLGSATKHFLELPLFAKWVAPLSLDLQSRVKQIVREMLAKSKSGGGQVDLERFLGALARRLQDAQATEDAMARTGGASYRAHGDAPVATVAPGVLLTRLHQLNVSVRKPELAQLLRHFGMEGQREIDYTAFLRRLFELAHALPLHGDRQ